MMRSRSICKAAAAALTALAVTLPVGVCAEVNDFLLPDALERVYSTDELRTLPLNVMAYARNEIYARHGRQFNSDELQAYFDDCSWYKGFIAPADFDEDSLSGTERENVDRLLRLERRLGGYSLDDEYGYASISPEAYIEGRDGYNILSGLRFMDGEDASREYILTDEFSLEFPSDSDLEIQALTNTSFELVHVPSRLSTGGGSLISIGAFDIGDDSYVDAPHFEICGQNEDRVFVAFFPTDVQFDIENEAESKEYNRLSQWFSQVSENAEAETGNENPFQLAVG